MATSIRIIIPVYSEIWREENHYTVKKGDLVNEKPVPHYAHPDVGLPVQVQLLLEFGGRIPDHEHRYGQGRDRVAQGL
jgi:hypothetical protein